MRDGVAKQKFTGGKKKVKICFREASVSDQWRKGSEPLNLGPKMQLERETTHHLKQRRGK